MIINKIKHELLEISLKIAFIELCAEFAIMYGLSFLEGHINPYLEMYLDPIALVIITTPIISFFIIYPYIRNRNETEATLSSLRDEALAANKTKSEFLAMMSHELRTPLNAIIGYSEFLFEECQEKNPEFIEDLGHINTAGKHLLALINDILDLSKLEAGKAEAFEEIFSFHDLVNNVVSIASPLMKMNNNELIVDVHPSLGLMNTDFMKLRQNLLNLLSNAAKFTENGNITLSIHVDDEDWVIFSVTDTGDGMTPEQLKKLFNPFVQGDSSTTRKYGGTGLGLTLFKRYTELLGGTISVESVPQQGSTFKMRLPRGSVDFVAGTSLSKNI